MKQSDEVVKNFRAAKHKLHAVAFPRQLRLPLGTSHTIFPYPASFPSFWQLFEVNDLYDGLLLEL